MFNLICGFIISMVLYLVFDWMEKKYYKDQEKNWSEFEQEEKRGA